MSEGDRPNQPQRFCTNCGAALTAGTGFCVSCGVALSPPDPPEIANDATDFESPTEKERPNEARPRPDEEVAGRTPRDIYREYDLHRRFFQEAREGLARFSERLRDGAARSGDGKSLSHNDLARALLYAQRGINKVEEYEPALTTLPSREPSRREAESVLADMREGQKDVLASVRDLYKELRDKEGYAWFKDEFVQWYAHDLRPYVQADPEPQRRPVGGPGNATQAEPENAAARGAYNGFINWFKDLPAVPKLVLAGLALLTLLVVFSPLVFRVGEILVVVSIVVVAVKAYRRKSLRAWGFVAAAAIPATLLCGITANLVHNTAFLGGIGYELSGEEKEYVADVERIESELLDLAAEQGRLVQAYPNFSTGEYYEAVDVLAVSSYVDQARGMPVPSGCENHHEVWKEGINNLSHTYFTANEFLLSGSEEDRSFIDTFSRDADEALDEARVLLDSIQRRGCEG